MPDRITVGNVDILAFLDMVPPPYEPTNFFPDVPLSAWDPYSADHLEDGQLQLYFGCFALRTRGQVVMVDTGVGPGPHASHGNRRGDMLNKLALRGISPEDVTMVVHTHLHYDHVGWNVTWEGSRPRATFPNARYLVPRSDWEYSTAPAVLEKATHIKESVLPLKKLGVMDLIEGEQTVSDEISTVPTPGHTPGHINVIVSSQGQKAVVVGDVFHSKVQVQEPGWCPGVDVDAALGTRSREALLAQMEQEGFIAAAGHFKPEEQFGRVIRLQGRRYWQVL